MQKGHEEKFKQAVKKSSEGEQINDVLRSIKERNWYNFYLFDLYQDQDEQNSVNPSFGLGHLWNSQHHFCDVSQAIGFGF